MDIFTTIVGALLVLLAPLSVEQFETPCSGQDRGIEVVDCHQGSQPLPLLDSEDEVPGQDCEQVPEAGGDRPGVDDPR